MLCAPVTVMHAQFTFILIVDDWRWLPFDMWKIIIKYDSVDFFPVVYVRWAVNAWKRYYTFKPTICSYAIQYDMSLYMVAIDTSTSDSINKKYLKII